jgi:hypothetical protein
VPGSGINGGSSGKDGVITLGDHALVFSELRQVTCGLAVHTAVHNRRDVRITGGILWTTCGHGKTQNEFRWGSCVTRAEGVKILSPQETGTIPGLPRAAGKAGKPVFTAGAWHRRAARGAGESGQPDEPEQRGRATGRSGPVRLGSQLIGNGEAGRPADSGAVRPGNWPIRGHSRTRPPSSHT